MIGMKLYHSYSGLSGVVDAIEVHPDGRALCRVNDHWFFADECRAIDG